MHVEDVEDTEMHPKNIFSEQSHNLFQTNELFFFLKGHVTIPFQEIAARKKKKTSTFFFFFPLKGHKSSH